MGVGSELHGTGECAPCAWFYKRGCTLGASCRFCHLCPDGELRERRKNKNVELRQERIEARGISAAELAADLGRVVAAEKSVQTGDKKTPREAAFFDTVS